MSIQDHATLRPYLIEQMRLHPSMTPQDLAKLCYQAAYGAEHLLSDLHRAKAYLLRELEATEADGDIPLTEAISDSIARVNLAPWKARGLSSDLLFELFAATATVSGHGDAALDEYLTAVTDCLSAEEERISAIWGGEADGTDTPPNVPAVTLGEWLTFLSWYNEQGRPPIHHSPAYREAERPAYRIVRRELLAKEGL